MFVKKSMKVFVLVVMVLALSGFTYAFAAANTMPTASYAGDGSVTISGYIISNVNYDLDNSTPVEIDNVEFTLNAPASTAMVSLVTGGTWFPCVLDGAGTTATCAITGVTVLAANSLQVVAAD